MDESHAENIFHLGLLLHEGLDKIFDKINPLFI